MSALMRTVILPACRRIHKGTLSVFISRRTYCTSEDTVKDEARLKELFDTYDADGSGEISEDELYSIVEELIHNKASAMHIVNKMMEDCDKDKGGTISFEEFKSGMQSYIEFFLDS